MTGIGNVAEVLETQKDSADEGTAIERPKPTQWSSDDPESVERFWRRQRLDWPTSFEEVVAFILSNEFGFGEGVEPLQCKVEPSHDSDEEWLTIVFVTDQTLPDIRKRKTEVFYPELARRFSPEVCTCIHIVACPRR